MSFNFKKVAFSCYTVKNMDRARQFYEGVLGFKPGEMFQETWQEYDLGPTTFTIATMELENMKPGSQSSVTFEVDGIEECMSHLKAKGVKFKDFGEGPLMETPVCRMAFFTDPDGNTLGLHQLK